MRILTKILLTIAVIIIAMVFQAIMFESGGTNVGVIRLIPAAILIFGIIGVWRYKPKKSKSDNNKLDKTI